MRSSRCPIRPSTTACGKSGSRSQTVHSTQPGVATCEAGLVFSGRRAKPFPSTEDPNTKLQDPDKLQTLRVQRAPRLPLRRFLVAGVRHARLGRSPVGVGVWGLVFIWRLELGAWCFVHHAPPSPPNPVIVPVVGHTAPERVVLPVEVNRRDGASGPGTHLQPVAHPQQIAAHQ